MNISNNDKTILEIFTAAMMKTMS